MPEYRLVFHSWWNIQFGTPDGDTKQLRYKCPTIKGEDGKPNAALNVFTLNVFTLNVFTLNVFTVTAE